MTHPQPIPKSTSCHWLLACAVASLAFLAATFVPAQTTTAGAKPAIDIQAATDGISAEFFATTARNVLTLNVRVVGPDRFVFEQRVEDTVLQWIPPGDLADGFYHWEAWVVSADTGAPMRELTPALEARAADHWFDEEFRQTHLATGSFRVELGLLEVHNPPRAEDQGPSLPARIAGAMLEFLVPSAHAFEEGSSNNFFGTDAGANNDGNNNNSFFGGEAGRENTTGTDNAFFGRSAGRENTEGFDNAFFGTSAGLFNTTGNRNAFFGRNAGALNTTGNRNAFFGHSAGFLNTTGDDNAFFGDAAGSSNTTGTDNAFFGRSAGLSNTTGSFNAFFGRSAGLSNTTGFFNAFFGPGAGFSNTEGSSNAFFGDSAGSSNTTGTDNAFFGSVAGFSNTEGFDNAFFGRNAGASNTTGADNAFFGRDTGGFNTTGTSNAFFGRSAGLSNTDEDNNTFIGFRSNGAAGITNATALGHRAQVTQSDSLVLGSINGVNGAAANTDVGIGISAPARALHVRRTNNTAEIMVEETGASSVQEMFSLVHNGHPKFRMTDTSQSSVSWEFRTAGTQGSNERFQINKIGSGAIEMLVRAGGNVTIAGSLTQGSSRTIKERITELDPEQILARLDALPVHEWSYQRSPKERHLGPMAEDFHNVFGLGGSDKHIAPGDLAGVALAAAKGLAERSAELEEETSVLRAENAELRDRLERETTELRNRLEQLEATLLSSM